MIELPTVACVMLTRGDRPEMFYRAVRAFEGQDYPREKRRLFSYVTADRPGGIGALRNYANAQAMQTIRADIIMHWDDDDWSGPNRISFQAQSLIQTASDVVGYRDMVFQDVTKGETWIYRHASPTYAVGTSLCYWSRIWRQKPFPDVKTGEDTRWIRGLKVWASSVLGRPEPAMIATIHGGNCSSKIHEPSTRTSNWSRADEELSAKVRAILENA